MRRSELERLRWGHVNLLEATLRVVESKSEEGEQLIALPATVVNDLTEQFQESPFKADTDYVFAHPGLGTSPDDKWFRAEFDKALRTVGITDRVRVHDLRHTALTNMAAAGSTPIAVMATAGHRSMQTTNRDVHLAGTVFRQDADALERRLLAGKGPTQPSTPPSMTVQNLSRFSGISEDPGTA